MNTVLAIRDISKTYASGVSALKPINLDIEEGEIFALLGPNGAGKTTLISIICGIVTPSTGSVKAGGHDVQHDYRAARSLIGLVPQELATDSYETVWATVSYSRGLFGCAPNAAYIEKVLRALTLWDKREARIRTLSGGMKRPRILFLDEPTAGVDVELRRDMWALVRELREQGVTIILTTHYIEEAEEMADRVGVINHGELMLVEDKLTLMKKLGQKHLKLNLHTPLAALPTTLAAWQLSLEADGHELHYLFDTRAEHSDVPALLRALDELGIGFKDLNTEQSSLEDIFVGLVSGEREHVA